MESEERPAKLRKLSHGSSGDFALAPVEAPSHAQFQSAPTQNAAVEYADETEAGADTRPEERARSTASGLESALNAQMDRTSDAEGQPAEPVLSKNQLKKLKRKAEWEAGREDRKLKRKEKSKEKKARKRAQREEELEQRKGTKDMGLHGDDIHKPKARMPPRKRPQRLPVAFVIDCGFNDLMVEKEHISLGSQITRAYSDNSKAPFQAHLYVSSWTEDSELRKRFEGLLKAMYKNWKGMVFTEKDFVAASEMAKQDMTGKYGGKMLGAFEKYAAPKEEGKDDTAEHVQGPTSTTDDQSRGKTDSAETECEAAGVNITAGATNQPQANGMSGYGEPPVSDLQEAGDVIYLTSDSPYTLTELKPYHTYIIGGLVDKNRHKGICYKTALDQNAALASSADSSSTSTSTGNTNDSANSKIKVREIKTAKLPIGEYMTMTARHVLATNHVVEIMLRWLETGDWGQAFLSVMPKRKGGMLRNVKAEDEDDEEGSTDVVTGAHDDEVNSDDEHQGDTGVQSSEGDTSEADLNVVT